MKKLILISSAFLILSSPLVSMAVNYGYGVNAGTVFSNQNPAYYSGNSSYGSYGSGSQCSSGNLTLCSLINTIIGYLNQILFLLIGLSVVVFVYYIFKYFIQPNEDRKQAGTYVMYSVIGFFVILSMWGLVNILQNTFGLGNGGYAPSTWSQVSNIFPTK